MLGINTVFDSRNSLAACNPNACRATGRGLQPKGVRMRETADFKVDTRAAGSGDLGVTIKGPSKCSGEFVLQMCFGEGVEAGSTKRKSSKEMVA